MNLKHKLLVAWLLTLAGLGCQKKSTENIAPAAEKPLLGQSDQPKLSDIEIKLLDPGAEPRTQLRYQFQLGKKDTMIMDLRLAMAVSMGDNKQPETQLPTVRTTMEVLSKEISAQGDLRYEFNIVDSQVLEESNIAQVLISAMREEANRTKGLSGWAVVSDRGYTKQAEINTPQNASPQLKQMVDNMRRQIRSMSSPFPEEAVGLGAKWQVKAPIATDTIVLEQLATYSLQEIKGTKGKLLLSLEQQAQPQQIRSPELQPGTQAFLNSLESSATGTMRYQLTQLIPNSEMKMKMVMNMTVEAQGQKQPVTMDTKVEVAIKAMDK